MLALSAPSLSPPVRFQPANPEAKTFRAELNRRFAEYFRSTGKSRRDTPGMYVKTGVVIAWAMLSYAWLVFGPLVFAWQTPWITLIPAFSLGLALAGIGFNVQHDGNHGAYSKHPWINRLAGATMDLIGASSYRWKWKHNRYHHTYTNVDGVDDDIGLYPARSSLTDAQAALVPPLPALLPLVPLLLPRPADAPLLRRAEP